MSEQLPQQFNERVRPDIIKRAVLSIQSKNRQSYGHEEKAGLKHSTYWRNRNNAYRSRKGKGMSRVPRKITVRRGSQLFGPAAESPNTRGGRRAHGPTPEKEYEEEINNKERRKAIRSALTASTKTEIVGQKHIYNGELPIITEDLETIEETSELKQKLEELDLKEELERVKEKKVRPGKGKNRGRKYRRKVGPLVVTAEDKGIKNAASNLPGVETSLVEQLNAEKLAPGAQPGRLIVWDQKAIEKLENENLYQ